MRRLRASALRHGAGKGVHRWRSTRHPVPPLRALLPKSLEWWESYVEEDEYAADAEGLAAFINEHLSPLCYAQEKEARHHEAIKNQALGEGLQAYKLEKLSRYETHLDRKFERSLGMLIKLKELRGSRLA